jgi:hypothetical protein
MDAVALDCVASIEYRAGRCERALTLRSNQRVMTTDELAYC